MLHPLQMHSWAVIRCVLRAYSAIKNELERVFLIDKPIHILSQKSYCTTIVCVQLMIWFSMIIVRSYLLEASVVDAICWSCCSYVCCLQYLCFSCSGIKLFSPCCFASSSSWLLRGIRCLIFRSHATRWRNAVNPASRDLTWNFVALIWKTNLFLVRWKRSKALCRQYNQHAMFFVSAYLACYVNFACWT